MDSYKIQVMIDNKNITSVALYFLFIKGNGPIQTLI